GGVLRQWHENCPNYPKGALAPLAQKLDKLTPLVSRNGSGVISPLLGTGSTGCTQTKYEIHQDCTRALKLDQENRPNHPLPHCPARSCPNACGMDQFRYRCHGGD